MNDSLSLREVLDRQAIVAKDVVAGALPLSRVERTASTWTIKYRVRGEQREDNADAPTFAAALDEAMAKEQLGIFGAEEVKRRLRLSLTDAKIPPF